MNKKITSYRLIAELQTTCDGVIDINRYERNIHVRRLKPIGTKGGFDSRYCDCLLVDVHTDKVQLFLSPSLQKARCFIQSTLFAYDWIQLVITAEGRLNTMINPDEVRSNWDGLKKKLSAHYLGDAPGAYMAAIDEELNSCLPVWTTAYQYFHLGLIFPHIPPEAGKGWERTRLVQLSHLEDEIMEEQIYFKEIETEQRIFSLSGKAREGSPSVITKYEGQIRLPLHSILPIEAEAHIIFNRGKIENQWTFSLKRILPIS